MEYKIFSPAPLDGIENLEKRAFVSRLGEELSSGGRVLTYFGFKNGNSTRLLAAAEADGKIDVFSCVAGEELPSLTPSFPQLHLFEREIAEQTGLRLAGHPRPNPVRYQGAEKPAAGDFFRVRGHETHEVAVGPVHAGVIEPGHFRFQCHGEKVFHLQIELGYQHRGIEEMLKGGPGKKTLNYMETAAGDTSIGHSWAYVKNVETLAGTAVTEKAESLRALMLELERIANHAGDLGALSGDVAYLPTAAFCGRIRGDVLNSTALVCGNRFGRNFMVPGGVNFDLNEELRGELSEKLFNARADLENAVSLLFEKKTVADRFRGTGKVVKEDALKLGLVGPAARASGVGNDVRERFPDAAHKKLSFQATRFKAEGDVNSRALVRRLEIQDSFRLAEALLADLPAGEIKRETPALRKNSFALSLVEGWRGEICHAVLTDENGKFLAYKITDPSFRNWEGLALALRNAEISDFPLCNKSFNLSYCGHDL